jgi:methionine aminopeptidase
MIPIKACQEIDKMQRGGQILAKIMAELAAMVSAGVTTKELDEKAGDLIRSSARRLRLRGITVIRQIPVYRSTRKLCTAFPAGGA